MSFTGKRFLLTGLGDARVVIETFGLNTLVGQRGEGAMDLPAHLPTNGSKRGGSVQRVAMKISSPIVFEPLVMERVWGGRRFETLLGKHLPDQDSPVGELWEIVDRPGYQSIVREGELRGATLHDLWTTHRRQLFGSLHVDNPSHRFPLLIKLLDARERLSVQVHPPSHCASSLGGEPKTECWLFLPSRSEAFAYAGLKRGVTRADFEKALLNGTVESTFHHISVSSGQSIFIPSGRVHAIGEGLVIEVQENSDTTYRVFDWNRPDLNGNLRALHIQESLACIDFEDFEPSPTAPHSEVVADCAQFQVFRRDLIQPVDVSENGDFAIVTCLTGELICESVSLKPGEFMLVPACMSEAILSPSLPNTTFLLTRLPAPELKRRISSDAPPDEKKSDFSGFVTY